MTDQEHLERLEEAASAADKDYAEAMRWAVRTIRAQQARIAELERQERIKVGDAISVLKKADETCGANFIEEFMQKRQRIAELQAEVSCLREALEQYAKKENWRCGSLASSHVCGEVGHCCFDHWWGDTDEGMEVACRALDREVGK